MSIESTVLGSFIMGQHDLHNRDGRISFLDGSPSVLEAKERSEDLRYGNTGRQSLPCQRATIVDLRMQIRHLNHGERCTLDKIVKNLKESDPIKKSNYTPEDQSRFDSIKNKISTLKASERSLRLLALSDKDPEYRVTYNDIEIVAGSNLDSSDRERLNNFKGLNRQEVLKKIKNDPWRYANINITMKLEKRGFWSWILSFLRDSSENLANDLLMLHKKGALSPLSE